MEQELSRGEAVRKEGLIEFYDSFKEMFEFFCKNTTIHGTIRLVCSGRNRMKTAFWTLLLLASFGMLYWQFALMFSQYWAYPVVLTMSMHSEPKMFPAVTICNLDPYRFNVVSEPLEQLDLMAKESLTFLYGANASGGTIPRNDGKIQIPAASRAGNLSGFRLSHDFSLLRMTHLRSGRKYSTVGFRLCNSTGGNCFFKAYSSGMDAMVEWYRFHYMNIMARLPAIIDVSQHEEHIDDMVYSCQYDGEPCRPGDYVHFHHPVFGSCYTFNSKGTDPFWTATKPGIPYGLSLILRAEQKDHIPLLSTVAGVKVMIHNHNQTPFLEHEGFDIRPGIATTVGIRQDEVNRLGGNYGKCTMDGNDVDVELLYNNSYTLQACLHSCFQHIMVRQCGCGYYYYPLPAGARYCDYNREPAWGHCFYQLYSRLRNHHLNCFEQCPKPCRESLYKVSAGTAKWPSAKSQDWVRQALRHQNGYNSTSNRKDIAKVTIFYQQLNYQAVNESPLLSVNLLLSSMGSQWSLWFGSSVLSVLEMLELLVDTVALSLLLCLRGLRGRSALSLPGPGPAMGTHRERPGERRGTAHSSEGREQQGPGTAMGTHRERPGERRERPGERRDGPQSSEGSEQHGPGTGPAMGTHRERRGGPHSSEGREQQGSGTAMGTHRERPGERRGTAHSSEGREQQGPGTDTAMGTHRERPGERRGTAHSSEGREQQGPGTDTAMGTHRERPGERRGTAHSSEGSEQQGPGTAMGTHRERRDGPQSSEGSEQQGPGTAMSTYRERPGERRGGPQSSEGSEQHGPGPAMGTHRERRDGPQSSEGREQHGPGTGPAVGTHRERPGERRGTAHSSEGRDRHGPRPAMGTYREQREWWGGPQSSEGREQQGPGTAMGTYRERWDGPQSSEGREQHGPGTGPAVGTHRERWGGPQSSEGRDRPGPGPGTPPRVGPQGLGGTRHGDLGFGGTRDSAECPKDRDLGFGGTRDSAECPKDRDLGFGGTRDSAECPKDRDLGFGGTKNRDFCVPGTGLKS